MKIHSKDTGNYKSKYIRVIVMHVLRSYLLDNPKHQSEHKILSNIIADGVADVNKLRKES